MNKIIYYIDPYCRHSFEAIKSDKELFKKYCDDGHVHLYANLNDFMTAFNNGYISDEGFIMTTDDGVDFYIVIKAVFTDDEQTIKVLSVSDDKMTALSSFNDAVETEVKFEEENGVSYNAGYQTETAFEAYNEGRMLEGFVSIFIENYRTP